MARVRNWFPSKGVPDTFFGPYRTTRRPTPLPAAPRHANFAVEQASSSLGSSGGQNTTMSATPRSLPPSWSKGVGFQKSAFVEQALTTMAASGRLTNLCTSVHLHVAPRGRDARRPSRPRPLPAADLSFAVRASASDALAAAPTSLGAKGADRDASRLFWSGPPPDRNPGRLPSLPPAVTKRSQRCRGTVTKRWYRCCTERRAPSPNGG
jgi:hypothetical protein